MLIQSILRLPDVVCSQEETVGDREHEAVMEAVGQALAHLDEFRTQEGAILIADLLKRIDRIEAYKQEVIPFEKPARKPSAPASGRVWRSCRPR